MREKPDLSIIFGTYNRRESLERCLRSIVATMALTPRFTYEIVVVDGGSTDGSYLVLQQHEAVSELIMETERRGAVRAFNTAYKLSKGRHIAVLNDDIELKRGPCLDGAICLLDDNKSVGQVALAYKYAYQHDGIKARVFTIHGKNYANLGVIRRDVAEKCRFVQGGLWNPRYHTYAADTELSCWVHKLGYEVRALPSLCAIDHEVKDDLRVANNSGRNVEDSKAFGRRWPTMKHIEPTGLDPLVDEDELARFKEVRSG